MIKKTITHLDFDGEQVTRDYYFNLTKADLAELEFSIPGGFDAIRKQITSNVQDGRRTIGALLDAYKILIAKAVGSKTLDGRGFYKSKEFTESFMASDAYSELVIELMNAENVDAIAEFFDGVVIGTPISVKEAMTKSEGEIAALTASIAETKES